MSEKPEDVLSYLIVRSKATLSPIPQALLSAE